MPLSIELSKQIEDLSRKNEPGSQEQIYFILCTAINTNAATPDDISVYSTSYWETMPSRYVIDATIFNFLAIFLHQSTNLQYRKYAGIFYKLAADRNSHWGCINFASLSMNGDGLLGVVNSPESALFYARRAVELTKLTTTPHLHSLNLIEILRSNHKYVEASEVLASCLHFNLAKSKADFKNEEVQLVINLLEKFIQNFFYHADLHFKGNSQLQIIPFLLEQIENFTKRLFSCSSDESTQIKLNELNFRLIYYKAIFLHFLVKRSEAMTEFLKLNDTKHPWHKAVISARARLLKETVSEMLTPKASAADATAEITEQLKTTVLLSSPVKTTSLVADSFAEQTSFSPYWKKLILILMSYLKKGSKNPTKKPQKRLIF